MKNLIELRQMVDAIPNVFCSAGYARIDDDLPKEDEEDSLASLYGGLPDKYSERTSEPNPQGEYVLRSEINKLARMGSDELLFKSAGGYHMFNYADIVSFEDEVFAPKVFIIFVKSQKVGNILIPFYRTPDEDEVDEDDNYYAWTNDKWIFYTKSEEPEPEEKLYEKNEEGNFIEAKTQAGSGWRNVLVSSVESQDYWTKGYPQDSVLEYFVGQVNTDGQPEVNSNVGLFKVKSLIPHNWYNYMTNNTLVTTIASGTIKKWVIVEPEKNLSAMNPVVNVTWENKTSPGHAFVYNGNGGVLGVWGFFMDLKTLTVPPFTLVSIEEKTNMSE